MIPIRSFRSGKRRLAGALSAEARWRLARGLADRAATAALAGGAARVMVVTGCAGVADWARGRDLEVVDDPGSGLDGAATVATTGPGAGSPWLVLHADLPLVTGPALRPLVTAAPTGPVIAPSYDGGTAVLGGNERRPFAYGPASFHAHLARTPHARVIVDHRLALDADTYRDLVVSSRLSGGAWLQPLLR